MSAIEILVWLGAACAGSLAAIIYWRRPPDALWPSLFYANFTAFLWIFGEAMTEFVADSESAYWLWMMVQYTGIIFLPPTWWLFALRFAAVCGHPTRLARPVLAYGPFVLAIGFWIAFLSNPWHGYYIDAYLQKPNEYHTVWYAQTFMAYLLMLLVLGLFMRLRWKVSRPSVRTQLNIMIIASALPTLSSFLYMVGVLPMDLTESSFAPLLLLLFAGIYRNRLFALNHLTLRHLLRHERDGVIIIDARGRLLYSNPGALQLLPPENLLPETQILHVLAQRLTLCKATDAPIDAQQLQEAMMDARQPAEGHVYRFDHPAARWLCIESTPVQSRRGRPLGAGLRLRDVTTLREAQLAVLQAKEEWERTFDAVPDLIAIIDKQNKIVRVNQAMANRLGITTAACVGQLCYGCIHNMSKPHPECPHSRTMEDMQQHTVEIYDTNLGGHFLVSTTPTQDVGGGFSGCVYVARDITEIKRAEEQRARFRRALEHSLNEIYIVDAKTLLFIEVNRGAQENLGYSIEELRHLTSLDLKPEITAEMLADLVAPLWDGVQEKVVFTTVHRRKDQSTYPVEVHLQLMKDGTPVYVAIILDITERKRAEEERDRLLLAIEHAAESIVITDAAGTIQYANPAFERITGYSLGEAIGENPRILKSGEHNDSFYTDMWDTLLRGETWSGEIVNKRKDGALYTEETTTSPVRDAAGNTISYVSVMHDITDRKRVEAEKLALERQVQHAQKLESLGVLAGGIAHDFNNILAAILGYAELAAGDLDDAHPAHESIQQIVAGANRAAELTRQMLAYSGKGKFIIEELDLSALMDDMAHLLRTSIPRRITLNLDLERALPPIQGDGAQVQQVIMNLITNASDAIGEKQGAIALSTGCMPCDTRYLAQNLAAHDSKQEPPHPGTYVYLEVSDTGCGMEKDVSSRIFEPFFTTKFTGRGLGMAAVLGIVSGHRGAIVLDSKPGVGSTFRVLFPAVAGASPDMAEVARTGLEDASMPQRGKILVVDDEEAIRRLTGVFLERRGFVVLDAADGREGIDLFREHASEIACVLLDLTMPHMSGERCFEALREIKEDVKVIVMSGFTEQQTSEYFSGTTPDGFLHKPFRQTELYEKIEKVLMDNREDTHGS